jgi:hypothetical protein
MFDLDMRIESFGSSVISLVGLNERRHGPDTAVARGRRGARSGREAAARAGRRHSRLEGR